LELKYIYYEKNLKKISLLALIVTVFSCNDSDLVIDSVLKTQQAVAFKNFSYQWLTYASGVNFTSANLNLNDATPFTLC
jgi:hypothetical protein